MAQISADAVLIAGPTASGKSAAAMALAEAIGGGIVNADSMQVYAEPRILTARPSEEDLQRVPHLLYGHVSVMESYSVGRYQADAARALKQVRGLGRVPVFVGGTGMYFSVLTEGIADIPPVPTELRERVAARRKQIGAEAFHVELAARDPDSATRLRPADTQRVLRAYEVVEATQRPLSEWQKEMGRPVLAGLTLARFVLAPPREELYARIDARFNRMVEQGAMPEAIALAGLDPSLPAAKILGLRELLAVNTGTMSLGDAKAAAKQATRNYAKRQLTWFRNRMADWTWIEQRSTSPLSWPGLT
ncbi:MAG: tRNA (adenosine(37)-N6)-dimethylallyltransferase MiaA, partial [Alphaproteobacteria bacterium]|nr:tRNA (adenosine(37)-N6)-dimethylallyltransferase MiaA [Alphaproteobacteria bacterium]